MTNQKKSIPVLGVDTDAWLTYRTAANGVRTYYVTSATSRQKLNLPAGPLTVKSVGGSGGLVEIDFSVEIASGFSSDSKQSRNVDYVFACSRCAMSGRVVRGSTYINDSPLFLQGTELKSPIKQSFRVKLDVDSVYELAKSYCRLNENDFSSNSTEYTFGSGTILVSLNGEESFLIELQQKLNDNIYNAIAYSPRANFFGNLRVLEMPTFTDPRKLGDIIGWADYGPTGTHP